MFYVGDQNSKKQIVDDTGKEIMPAIYDRLTIFQDSLIKFEIDNKYGIANTKGEIILSPAYDYLQGRIIGKEGKKGFLNEDYSGTYGGLIFDEIKYQKNDELLFLKDGLWGMCKLSDVAEILNKPFLPNQYQEIKNIGRGYMAKNEKQWLLFDHKGKSQLDISVDTIIKNEKKGNFLNLRKNNKWALYKFDSWENHKTPKFIYDEIDGYTVRIGKKWGTLHSKSMESIPIIYDEIKSIGFHTFLVRKENYWGCIDLYNQQKSPIQYDSIGWTNHDMIEAFKNKKAGIVDYDGNVLIPFQYHHIQANRHGQFLFTTKENKSGILNAQGQEIIPPLYHSIREVPTKYYKVTDDKKNGIVDTLGQVIIPCSLGDFYLSGGNEDIFANNRLLRIENSKYGFVNRYNELMIPYHFNNTSVFKNGVALIRQSKNAYFIDTLGNQISERYDNITSIPHFNKPFYIAEKNGKKGVITPRKIIIPLEYDDLYNNHFRTFDNRIFILKKDGKYGIVNDNNQVIYPFIFNQPIIDIRNGIIQTITTAKKRNYFPQEKSTRLYDGAGHLIILETTIELGNLNSINDTMTTFIKNKKYGLINLKSQQVLLPPIYKHLRLEKSPDGSILLFVSNEMNQQGILDIDGNIIVPLEYESLVINRQKTLIRGRKNGKTGWLDFNGNEKIPFIHNLQGSVENKIILDVQEKTGVIDLMTQQIIIPFEYEVIQCFPLQQSNDFFDKKSDVNKACLYNVKRNGTWFTINEQGERQNQFGDFRLEKTNNIGFYKFNNQGKYGLKNKDGKTILAPQFKSINMDPAGFITVTLKDAYTQGFYHLKEDRFYDIPRPLHSFWERNIPYRRISKSGKVGLINTDLKWTINPIFDNMAVYGEGLYATEKNGKTGFINPQGEVIIPFDYGIDFSVKKETRFKNGIAILHKKQKYGIINKENKIIIPFEYDAILLLENKDYLGRKNGKWITLSL